MMHTCLCAFCLALSGLQNLSRIPLAAFRGAQSALMALAAPSSSLASREEEAAAAQMAYVQKLEKKEEEELGRNILGPVPTGVSSQGFSFPF